LQQRQAELDTLAIDVLVVTFEIEVVARQYAAGLPWPVLLDGARELYQAYGMARESFWKVWGPASWWGFIKLLVRGRRLHLPTGDVYQMGGDVLINPQGIVRLHYVSRYPLDRPSVESLLGVVRAAKAS
jgi:alkyl hydroperoxide reductase subunit AhpC